MTYFEFEATQVFCELNDENLIIIALAEGVSPDPEKYIIIQRFENNQEFYSYEICGFDNSGIGGFKKVKISDEMMLIDFHDELKEKFHFSGLRIKLIDKKILECFELLKLTFKMTDCILDYNNF